MDGLSRSKQPFNTKTGEVTEVGSFKKKNSVKDSSCCTCTGLVTKSLSILTPLIAAAYNWKGQLAEKLPENLSVEFLKGMDVVGQIPGFLQTGVEEAMKGELDSVNSKVAVGTAFVLATAVLTCVVSKLINNTSSKTRQA